MINANVANFSINAYQTEIRKIRGVPPPLSLIQVLIISHLLPSWCEWIKVSSRSKTRTFRLTILRRWRDIWEAGIFDVGYRIVLCWIIYNENIFILLKCNKIGHFLELVFFPPPHSKVLLMLENHPKVMLTDLVCFLNTKHIKVHTLEAKTMKVLK